MGTAPCFATDNSRNEKNHIVGISLGFGDVNSDIPSEKDDRGTVAGVNYGYQFNSNWALNAGVIFGDSLCLIACPSDKSTLRNLSYDSYLVTLKGSLPISNRWSVFAKLGVNSYQVNLTGDDRDRLITEGAGGVIGTGFDFRAYNGFGVGIGVTLLDMEDLLAINSTVNISYLF